MFVLRSALFWVITQPIVVIPYRRFGTTYLSHLLLTLEDGADRLSRNACKELLRHCVIAHKSADLIHFAAED
jgi:hypothetical protein